jgi:hypothetical protein
VIEHKPIRITRLSSNFQVVKKLLIAMVFIVVCMSTSILLVGERSVSNASAAVPTTITLSPIPANNSGCATLQVQIIINDVVNLYGADVRLSFDPAMLEVIDDLPDPGINIQPTDSFLTNLWVVKNEVDNAAGTIWYAVTQLNPATPKSGSGALANIHLRGKMTGTSSLSFTYIKLVDMQAIEIPATSTDGCVQIQLHYLPLVLK